MPPAADPLLDLIAPLSDREVRERCIAILRQKRATLLTTNLIQIEELVWWLVESVAAENRVSLGPFHSPQLLQSFNDEKGRARGYVEFLAWLLNAGLALQLGGGLGAQFPFNFQLTRAGAHGTFLRDWNEESELGSAGPA
jgi:hypothetical protein